MRNHINKYLFLLIIFSHTLYGCALCAIYSPETRVSINIKADENTIKSANVTWVLTKKFTQQLYQVYDMNQNNYLDKEELKPIKKALLDYVVRKNYLTFISYDKIVDKTKSKPVLAKNEKIYIKNGLLHFNYTMVLNYKVVKDNILYFNVNDDESYFILLLVKRAIKFKAPFKVSEVFTQQSVAFSIDSVVNNNNSKENIVKEHKKIQKEEKSNKINETKKSSNKNESTLVMLTKKLKEYLIKINKGDNYALLVLLLISFIYGIVHALGPGHGKSLAFSYFLANKSSIFKAFLISQASAFIHIIGALVLVVVSIFFLESILNNFVSDSIKLLTQISAGMIIVLASYILYNKLRKKSCSCSACCSSHSVSNHNHSGNVMWSTTPKTNNKLKVNFVKKDLYFVLTAGLIPCPGTVILFIYAFFLKTYFAVFLASIAISLGMGIVIFASSFLGVSFNKVSQKSQKLTNIAEIVAPIFMMALGFLLFFNANLLSV